MAKTAHHHEPYPELADAIGCAKELIAAWDAGTMFTDFPATAKHLYTLVGFSLAQAFGEPDNLIGSGAPLRPEEAIESLRVLATVEAKPTAKALPPIPWKKLAAWALKLLLEQLAKG